MSYLITEPQLMASVAADVDGIRSVISAAGAAAAGPTSGLLAPAADEVSAAITKLFGAYGQEYRAVVTQAEAGLGCGVRVSGFNSVLVQGLSAAASASKDFTSL
jgi:hypothetical protein